MNGVKMGRVERLEMAVSALLKVMDSFEGFTREERAILVEIGKMISGTMQGEVVEMPPNVMQSVQEFARRPRAGMIETLHHR